MSQRTNQNIKIQQRQLVRKLENLGEKPEKRISKRAGRLLRAGAIFGEVIDTVGGTVPILGDLLAWLFNSVFLSLAFWYYGVSFPKLVSSGSGGWVGTLLLSAGEVLVGLVPAVGDIADAFYASWYYKTTRAIKKIQAEDRQKIADYKKKKLRLSKQLQALQHGQVQIKQKPESQNKNKPANSLRTRSHRLRGITNDAGIQSPYGPDRPAKPKKTTRRPAATLKRTQDSPKKAGQEVRSNQTTS
jgi:hypothetical protein